MISCRFFHLEKANITDFSHMVGYLTHIPKKIIDSFDIHMTKSYFFELMRYFSYNKNMLLLLLLLLVAIFFLFIAVKKKNKSKKAIICKNNVKKATETNPLSNTMKENLKNSTDIDKIAHFFLNIFKLQNNASENARTNIKITSYIPLSSSYVYELCINIAGVWKKRRMSIRQIGEESGSRSKCYYVIYDVHMVIKIPSEPINDFVEYIEKITKEGFIVDRLAPKECIIPKISVILQMVHTFSESNDLSKEKLEKKYIKWAGNFPIFQEYLKICGNFVFFMDLSKYFFLGQIIRDIHDVKNKMYEEITGNSERLWALQEFEGRYGVEKNHICNKIKIFYTKYEEEVRNLLNEFKALRHIQQYQIQKWFLNHLAEEKIKPDEIDFAPEIIEKLNSDTEKMFALYSQDVSNYRKMIRDYVYNLAITQKKSQIVSIVANILDLLAWLRQKNVAIRDLKPDNLLVAGDKSQYPHFLISSNLYSIGLIDVETAVAFEKSCQSVIKQPQLGGTPFYATPSHFMPNELLTDLFKDVKQVFYLQDLYAVIVIIYKIITGNRLFEKTAKTLPYTISHIQNILTQGNNKYDTANQYLSQMFWSSAAAEIFDKSRDKEKILKSISIDIGKNVKKMFMQDIYLAQQTNAKVIKTLIESEKMFNSKNIKQHLIKTPYKTIKNFIKNIDKKHNTIEKKRAIKALKKLKYLKLQNILQANTINILKQPNPKMTAYELINFMFNIVLIHMFQEKWGVVSEKIINQYTEHEQGELCKIARKFL